MKTLLILVALMIQACGQDNAPKKQAYTETADKENALERLKQGGGLTGQASDKDLATLGLSQDQYQNLLISAKDQISFIAASEELVDCAVEGDIVYWARTNYYYTCMQDNWRIVDFNEDLTQINGIY